MPRNKIAKRTTIDVAVLTMLIESMPHKSPSEWKSLAAEYNKLVQPCHKSDYLHLCNYWKRWNRKEVNDALLIRLVDGESDKHGVWRRITEKYNEQEDVKKTQQQLCERYREHLDPDTKPVSEDDYEIIRAFIDKNLFRFIQKNGQICWSQILLELLEDENFKEVHRKIYGNKVYPLRLNSLKNKFASYIKKITGAVNSNDSAGFDENSPDEDQPRYIEYAAPQESSPMIERPAHGPLVFCDDVQQCPPPDETLLSIWQSSNSKDFEQGGDELLREAVVVPRTSRHCFFLPEALDPESIFDLSDMNVSTT